MNTPLSSGSTPRAQTACTVTADWGHGWRYFSDPAARRAVVISPQGDYYYSRGKGLRRVAAAELIDNDWLAVFEWDAGHQSIARSRESQWIEKEIRR